MRRRKHDSFVITATRDCINNSERNSLSWCVWALAVIYSVPGAIKVQVDKAETRFTYKGYRYVFPTPEKAARIAKSYDAGEVTKAEMSPWRDTLKNPISVEPSRHARPRKVAADKVKRATKSKKTERCTPKRSNRWNGGRM